MRRQQPDRKAFLLALIDFAHESKTFNPHFYLGEMLDRLKVDEGTFNILRYSLGNRYCRFVDVHNGQSRYAISLADCLALRDDLEQRAREEHWHRHPMLIAVVAALLGAVVAALLTLWFTAG